MILGLDEKEYFTSGHRGCAGCGQALAVRLVTKAAGPNTIIANATGCLEVFSTPYPETSWKTPWIHVAFENAAAVIAGVDSALEAQNKRKGVNLLAFGGDGGTFDIGFQALSGAIERGHKFCYVCFDNGAYMNTGIQRSGATPKYASTTTTPAGKVIHGKTEFKKPMPFIVAAHGNCYVATASVAFPLDLVKKVKKALSFDGPSYVQVYCPCIPGWGLSSDLTIEDARRAYNSKTYLLFEIEDGIVKNLKKPDKEIKVEEHLKLQKRFKHLSKEEISEVQKHIDERWNKLVELEKAGIKLF